MIACCKAGALRRAVYYTVANAAGKNLKDCVSRRIDGADQVLPHGRKGVGDGWARCASGSARNWRWLLVPDSGRDVQQEGVPLGERLHEMWEWDAVLEQVAEFGWTALDIRWGKKHARARAHVHRCMLRTKKAAIGKDTCQPPQLIDNQ